MIRPAWRPSVFAVRVGVYTKPDPGANPTATCRRCGGVRHVKVSRPISPLCVDCKTVDPSFGKKQP